MDLLDTNCTYCIKMESVPKIQALWKGYSLRRLMPVIRRFIDEDGNDHSIEYILWICELHRRALEQEEDAHDIIDNFYSSHSYY